MNGTRLFREDGETDFLLRISKTPDAYGTENGKHWYCTTPNGLFGSIGAHTVEEHPDGTITVSPSILVNRGLGEQWHGYLERGVWRKC